MPGEFEPQDHVYMIWPECPDNWRNGAKPAQKVFTNVAMAIAKHTDVTMKFVRANPGKKAIITSLDKAIEALEGKTGTVITFA